MTLRDRMIRIIRLLRPANHMAPIHAYLVARGDADDLAGDGGLEAEVARDVGVVYVGDGVVGLGGADTVCEPEVLVVDAVGC